MNREQVISMIEKELGSSWDLFDTNAEYDSNISPEENLTILREKIKPLLEMNVKQLVKNMKAEEGKIQEQKESFVEKMTKEQKVPLFKRMFGEFRIVGLAGARNRGKTNNIMAALIDFRNFNKTSPIYYYGLETDLVNWIKENISNAYEVSSLEQLSNKSNSLIVLDEFQKLNLNDRRYRELLNMFIDFIYHNNNWVLFCSPNAREFNSIIGSKIERWVLKSLKLSDCINGSQLKMIVLGYKGRYKSINDLVVPIDKALVINDGYEEVLTFDYIKAADTKIGQINIFSVIENKNVEADVVKKDEPRMS